MTFDELVFLAAHTADDAVNDAMSDYSLGLVTDEDDLTGYLLGNLKRAFTGGIGGLAWKASILRHRAGKAAEEKAVGADMLIHVQLNTPTQKYSKGVLVQAKRVQPQTAMSQNDHNELVRQCRRMLQHSPASFVFDYAKGSMRCGPAIKIAGSTNRHLYENCDWTSYRFFLELFRCPVGDERIQSALVHELPIPVALSISASGQLSEDGVMID